MKATLTMTVAAGVLLLGSTALAQSSSPEVFRRVDTNISNAKANKEDTVRNLGTINSNINEVAKAKADVIADGMKVKSEMSANAKTIGDIEKSLDMTKKVEAQEMKSMELERKKIAELEEVIKKLQTSMDGRQKNLDTIRMEKDKLEASHADWKARGDELVKINAEVQVREQRVIAEEKEWNVKKTRFEKDAERWDNVLAKQEKIKKNLASLKSK